MILTYNEEAALFVFKKSTFLFYYLELFFNFAFSKARVVKSEEHRFYRFVIEGW